METTKTKRILTWLAVGLCSLGFISAAVFFTPSPAPAAPTINWLPSSLNVEIALGQAKSISITLTSSETVSNTHVQVVPQLQPYLQVSPSVIPNISKNQPVTLQVRFFASTGAIFGLHNGAIQLRLDRSNLSKPLPVNVLVTVVPLPPDPGEAGQANIPGIDSDGDGVRDDVERYIALSYPDSSKLRAVLAQLALASQRFLLSSTSLDINNAASAFNDGVECLVYISPENAGEIHAAFQGQVLNTKDRIAAYYNVQAKLDRATLAKPSPENLKASCIFDPDTLPN